MRGDAFAVICAATRRSRQFGAQSRPVPTDTRPVIGAKNAPEAPPEDATLLDASRWAVWQTLARGFAHSLANASQILMLDPPPPALLAEARARLTRAHAVVTATGRPGASASFLPSVLADFAALQQLQADLPAATLTADVQDPLPMAAMPEGDVLHALLLVGTRLKEACGSDRLELIVRARAEGRTLRVTMEAVAPRTSCAETRVRLARTPLLEATAALVSRGGGWLRESGSGWELGLPVWEP